MVQRVPLRVCFDEDKEDAHLRAGMSAYVSIDTGRSRSLAGVLTDLKGWLPGAGSASAAQK